MSSIRAEISHTELLNIQNEIFSAIQEKEADLLALQASSQNLIHKWQQFLQIVLPIQMHVIGKHNLEKSQSGISTFNQAYLEASNENSTLEALNKEKWLFIFEKAFGMTHYRRISLEEARELVHDITLKMTAEPFLEEVDQVSAHAATLLEKREALLTVLFPLHMSVMAQHDFHGEIGYIQAQRAIMDYAHDPLISEASTKAQQIVFARAGLI